MGLGYEQIVNRYDFCPTVIATGGLSCGKTTSLISALATIGSHKSGMYMYDDVLAHFSFVYSLFFKKLIGIYFQPS